MKFRKKPIIIEAEQWFPGVEIEGVYRNLSDNLSLKFDYAWIDTLEGKMKVSSGDWIITGVKGEKYPCKPDIFELTYEPLPRPLTRDEMRNNPFLRESREICLPEDSREVDSNLNRA